MKDIHAFLLDSNTVLFGRLVWLWLFYLFTPSAPFHFDDGQFTKNLSTFISYSVKCQFQVNFNVGRLYMYCINMVILTEGFLPEGPVITANYAN